MGWHPPYINPLYISRPTTKRQVFLSYHHGGDQGYYDAFSRAFSDTYGIIRDGSLDRVIDSDDSQYVMRQIREKWLTGTSCTMVLCGAQTAWRKFVDWEISATLDKQHGLLGIVLPTCPQRNGARLVPDRLYDNLQSGYARWVNWADVIAQPDLLASEVERAILGLPASIDNRRPLRARNG